MKKLASLFVVAALAFMFSCGNCACEENAECCDSTAVECACDSCKCKCECGDTCKCDTCKCESQCADTCKCEK